MNENNLENIEEITADTETAQPAEKPPVRWIRVNTGLLFFVFMPLSCWLLGGAPFTGILLAAAFLLSFLAGIFGWIHRRFGELGKAVMVTRIIAIVLAVLAFVIPFGRSHFNHTKVMYPVKRAMYTGGFMTEDYFYLPHSLPKKCGDYICITEFSTIAQDSHASAYLAFYTDTATIDEYVEYFTGIGYEKRETKPLTEEDIAQFRSDGWDDDTISETIAVNAGIAKHAIRCIGAGYTKEVVEPVVYIYDSHYPKGFFCDRGTGLVIIWT